VATGSRLLKLQVSCAEYSLFYRALLQKETYNFKKPTNRSHPISRDEKVCLSVRIHVVCVHRVCVVKKENNLFE